MYFWIKYIHAGLALLSLAGFMARGVLHLRDSPVLDMRWVRVVPHLIDTLLLLTGIWLAWSWRMHEHFQPWLGAKLLALIVYIGLGMVAFRFARGLATGLMAWFAAIAVFGYMLAVASTKLVWPLG